MTSEVVDAVKLLIFQYINIAWINVIEFDDAMVMVIQSAVGGPPIEGDQGRFPRGRNNLAKPAGKVEVITLK